MHISNLSLMTKRFFPRSKQVIFILGIVLISIITGFFGSFFTGITQRDYFVNSNDNIVTILETGYKSPVVSYIPSNYLDVLKTIKGITAISPEVHALVMINQVPATLHGITSSFFELNSDKVLAGQPLKYIITSNASNILIAGSEIASSLNLHVGNSYTLYSSNTNAFFTFYLAGIVKFNSFYDEELFTNIDAANYFRTQSATINYSMIRLKIDTNIITKDQINAYLSSKFYLTIKLISHFQDPTLIQNQTVKIFLTNGVLVGENKTNKNGLCSFYIPVGLYYAYFYSGQNVVKESFTFLNSSTHTFYIDSHFSDSNIIRHNLTLTTLYSYEHIQPTNVRLIVPDGRSFDYGSHNSYSFFNIINGNYTIEVLYNNSYIQQSFVLDSNLNLTVNFANKLKISILNANNQTLTNASCSFYNYQTEDTLNYNVCPSQVVLPKSLYNITVNDPTYGSNSEFFNLINYDQSNNLTIYVGNSTQTFQIFNNLSINLQNVRLYAKETTGTEPFYQVGSGTDSNGEITFNYTFGKDYYLLFSYGSINASYLFQPKVPTPIIKYYPFNQSSFTAYLFDGQANSTPLQNFPVNITGVDGQNYNKITLSSGEVDLNLNNEFVGYLSATFENITKSYFIDTLQNKIMKITLGQMNLDLTISSTAYELIPNVHINIISSNLNASYINSNGTLNLLLPTNPIYNPALENDFFSPSLNYTTFNTNFLLNSMYEIDLVINKSITSFYIPKLYYFQSFNYTFRIDYFFKVSFSIKDEIGMDVGNAKITLSNSKYTYVLITDINGYGSIPYVNPGNYSMTVQYADYQFNYNIVVTQDTPVALNVPFFIKKVNIAFWKPNIAALSGKQYLDEFYSTSINYFIQVFLVMIIVSTFILVMLFSSVIKLTVESINNEIYILNILGASKREVFLNLLYNFQLRTFFSSIVGLGVGMFLTKYIHSFNYIQILGFVFYSKFDIGYLTLFCLAINLIIFCVLTFLLRKVHLIYPIQLLRRT